jgi:hypothetical protein
VVEFPIELTRPDEVPVAMTFLAIPAIVRIEEFYLQKLLMLRCEVSLVRLIPLYDVTDVCFLSVSPLLTWNFSMFGLQLILELKCLLYRWVETTACTYLSFI